MNTAKKPRQQDQPDNKILLKAVERSAQIEGLSLRSAQENLKVIAELQKHGRAFAI